MTTAYSNLLGLALPVTGELSGTWGDTVNDYITKYLDDAIANAQIISGSQTAVTLSKTTGSSLVSAGSGATGSAQYALIRCTGNPASTLTITVSYSSLTNAQFSKTYLIFNSTSTSQSVVVQATTSSGTSTGVTITSGEKALIAWNGTDFVKIATQSGTGEFVTVDTTNLEVTNIKAKDGTAAATIADSTGAITVSTILNVDNLRLDTNTISSTDTNGNIVLAPNGTGDVQLDADTVRVGDSNVNVTITSNGTADLILNTNAGTNSGSITIEDGANGNIIIAPNGTGQVQISNAALDLTTIEVTNIKAKDGTASMTLADSTGVVTFSANPVLNAGTANGVPYLNASKVLTTGSALTFDGTTLVSGTGIRANSYMEIRSNTSTLYWENATNTLYWAQKLTGSDFVWDYFNGTSLAEQMRLTSTGLGIGTNNPGYKLDAQVASNVRVARFKNTSSTVQDYTLFAANDSDTIIGMGVYGSAAGTTGMFGANSPFITASAELNLGATSGSGVIKFASGGTAEKMRLDSSGNLGLGVTPSAKLEIYSTNNAFNALQVRYNGSNDAMGFGIGNSNGFPYLGYNTKSQASVDAPVYERSNPAAQLRMDNGSFKFNIAPSGTANTTTITNGVSYTIITSGNQTDFGAANNNVGTSFTATSSGTLSSGTVSQNISFTQAMTLDASGNLVVGATSTSYRMEVVAPSGDNVTALFRSGDATAANNAGGGFRSISSATAGDRRAQLWLDADGANFSGGDYFWIDKKGNSGEVNLIQQSNAAMLFSTNGTERARITSGGYFKASNAGTYNNSAGAYHELYSNASGDWIGYFTQATATNPNGVVIQYTAAAPNGTGNTFLYCNDNAAVRATIRSNGGLANYQSNNVDLSDIRTKTDISPLASYWNKIAALEIVSYKYKDQTHNDLNIGVIAQQVEQVAPEFVDADGFGETPEDGVPLKTIYNKDLTFAAIKALQEAMARIEKLEAEVAALKGA